MSLVRGLVLRQRKRDTVFYPQEKIGPIRVGLRKKAKDYFYCTRTRRVGIGTFST